MSEELCILNGGVQTVAPQLAAPQVVYLDFDGAVTSYVNADLGVAVGDVIVDDSGFMDGDIAVIVDALNGMFDDVVFTSALPSDGEFSTIYVGVTSAFDEYGAFLGLAETIDSGNRIRDDNAFVLLDSSADAELVVSVIAHETEHIVHGMDHGGEGLERFATDYIVGSGGVSSGVILISGDNMIVDGGTADITTVSGGEMSVDSGGVATSTTVDYGWMAVYGGTATITTVNNGGIMWVVSNGVATITTMNGGMMNVFWGGTATSTTVSGGEMNVSSGGIATITTVNGGNMSVYSGGTAVSTTVNGGEMSVYSGGKVTGVLTIADGAVVSAYDGGVIDFDISSLSPGNAPLVNKLSLVQGTPSYTLTVGDRQRNGTYILAGGADEFDKGVICANTTLTVNGEAKVIGAGTYALALNGGDLALTVGNVLFTDDVTDEEDMTYNMLASGVHVKDGGRLNVKSGGTANATIVSNGGSMHVSNGGTANSTTVSRGGLMEVLGGGMVGGRLTIEDGAVVSVHDEGVMEFNLQGVSPNSAPLVNDLSRVSGKPSFKVGISSDQKSGKYILANGAYGFNKPISIPLLQKSIGPDGIIVWSYECYTLAENSGSLEFAVWNYEKGRTVTSASACTVNNKQCVCSATISGLGGLGGLGGRSAVMTIMGGGMAFSTTIDIKGIMTVGNGGSALLTTVKNGGSMTVSSGARAVSNTVLSGGVMSVYGLAKSATVSKGGNLTVFGGGKMTGPLTIYNGATVNVNEGGVIDFDLTPLSPGNDPLVNGLSLIGGKPSYTVTVKADQALGEYRLAGGAGNFNGTLTVKCADEADVVLRVGDKCVAGETQGYSLAVTGGLLLLSVIDITPPDAPELTLSGDAASKELIVTAAWDTDDADCLYALNGSEELKEYDAPLSFGDDARVRFQTKDTAGNTTDRSMDLMFGRSTGKWAEGYRAWNPAGYDKTVELKGMNVIGSVFDGSDDSTILVFTDDESGDALFLDDIYSAYPDGTTAQKRISKVNEIMAGAGNDVVDLTSPRFDYTDKGVTVHGGNGDDVIWANSGVNRLFGDAGGDSIVGGDGNDVIVGGAGDDIMHGGGGDDIFCFCADWGRDTVEQLASDKVTLWFAEGDESKWDAAKCIYTDGDNSVTVTGVASTNITLKFGDDGGQYSELQAAGAFDAFTSEKIFENKNVGMHIAS